MCKILKLVVSIILTIVQIIGTTCLFQTGVNAPKGFDKIKVHSMPPQGYELVLEDNFDGDRLNTDTWYYRANGERRGGFNSPDQVSVSDGMLHIRHDYLTDGEYGEGWYAGMIATRNKYTRGYFEIRCRCNNTLHHGSWSAFWLQADHPYDPEISRGGIGGAEIDIVEAFRNSKGAPNCSGNIHCSGSKINAANRENPDDLDSQGAYRKVIYDCYHAFHTYSLLWDEDKYTFFVDGRIVAVSDWADGVCEVPDEVVVSLELSDTEPQKKDKSSEFTVDYVKIYQRSDDIQITKRDMA